MGAKKTVRRRAPHSQEYFGPERDFWWNADFLDLMADRWKLEEARTLADVGCGVGHWSRLLFPRLRQPARVTGIDQEPRSLRRARRDFARAFPDAPQDAFRVLRGDALRLPLPDDAFDVVTCQTVLMHLHDPLAALREMLRIARPGGLILAVEPNNLLSWLRFNSLTWGQANEALIRRYRFWLCYYRGKIRNDEGDHAIGDLLPGLFAQLGLTEIAVYQTDKASGVFPPYTTDEQAIMRRQEQSWRNAQTGPWDLPNLRRHVLAGGGTPALFARVVAEMRRDAAAEDAAIAAGAFAASYGTALYLVSGRKPVQSATNPQSRQGSI